MKIIRTVAELQHFVAEERGKGKTIGLVPTMGALHEGHLSLIDNALGKCDTVVASVFVNPTQFNNPTDLATYPRKEEDDFRLLEEAGASAVFAPAVEEVYPADDPDKGHVFDLGNVAEVMEGRYRPGHFQGVAQIVSRLLRWAGPDKAFFGEKDFQQIAVIRRMVQTEGIDVEIMACPIRRAEDGLALSSRNALLTAEERAVAPKIHSVMKEGVEACKAGKTPREVHDLVVGRLTDPFRVEYFEIVDSETLETADTWDGHNGVTGCITVYLGNVRLIDNIKFK